MAFLIAARRQTAAAFFAALLALSSLAAAQRPQGEDTLKAAYLYNFTKFIEWPASAFSGTTAPFTVCVLADDRFRREVEGILGGEKVGERPIDVTPSVPDDLKLCHLVYFSRTEAERLAKRLPELRQAPVLTVGEGLAFLEQGGLIAFVVDGDRVRFSVSRRSATTAGLTVSSKLLRVARPYDGVPLP